MENLLMDFSDWIRKKLGTSISLCLNLSQFWLNIRGCNKKKTEDQKLVATTLGSSTFVFTVAKET